MAWHGYIVIERLTIGSGNWATLQGVFEGMDTSGHPMPARNNHWRRRLDGDAVIHEGTFAVQEMTIATFKKLLADEFGVPVGQVKHQIGEGSYAGGFTRIWTFLYNDIERFKVERFGGGGASWKQSGDECRGYLALHIADWEEELE